MRGARGLGAGGIPGAGARLLALASLLGAVGGAGKDYGLTTYGEPCIDSCKQRGFPFTWCHKAKSRNGTFIDRDYCSAEYGVTRYSEHCLDSCERRDGKPFFWCHTHPTRRGDWDYCSPFPRDQCQWSGWGGWGLCSAPCGQPGSRTRRRRIEGAGGRVGGCSGETEVAFQACLDDHCSGPSRTAAASLGCEWGVWGSWGRCSRSCGAGGLRTRYRVLTKHSSLHRCPGDAEEMAECSEPSCPTPRPPPSTPRPPPSTTRPPVTPSLKGDRVWLGEFENTLHSVSGTVYTLGDDRLLLEDFTYDGSGPDAFFYIGTSGAPGPRGIVLAHPFQGKYYDYRDPRVPVLRGQPRPGRVVLTLPPGVPAASVRWVSVWCRQFAVDFGHVIRAPSASSPPGAGGRQAGKDPTPQTPPVSTTRVSSSTSTAVEVEVQDEVAGLGPRPTPDDSTVITVDLPDFNNLPAEQPRAVGGRSMARLDLNSFTASSAKQSKGKKHSSASSKGSKSSSGKVTGVKVPPQAGGGEDVDFTVIRVQSSVSQEVSDGANEELEEGDEATDVTTRPTVTVDGFKVDKLIEIPLGNIDGGTWSKGTTKPTTAQTTTSTTSSATTTSTTSSATSPATTTKKAQPELTRQGIRNQTKNSLERTSTAATTPRRLRPSLFHPASRRPNRLDILAKTSQSPILRRPVVGRTTPTTPHQTQDRELEAEIHNFFDTSTPKPRRFTVVPRLTTSATTNDQEDETNQRDEPFTPSNTGGITFRPSLVSNAARGISPPRPTLSNLFFGRGRDGAPTGQGASRTPLRPFSFRPKNRGGTSPATTPQEDPAGPTSSRIHPGRPTLSPRLPPLRTTPGPVTDVSAVDTTEPSGRPEAGGISARPRPAAIIPPSTVGTAPDAGEDLATGTPPAPSTRRPLFARRPGLLPRRPGLARSTTVSSILSTPKVRTRILNSNRNQFFGRRRSTTESPIESETLVPSLDNEGSVEENEIGEVTEQVRSSGDRTLSGFGTKPNTVDSKSDEKPTKQPFNRRNKFKNKFRPIRPPFLPRRTTSTTTEPIPQTTSARKTPKPRGPSSTPAFFAPTRATTEPQPQTTQGSRSRPAFSRFTTPSAAVTVTSGPAAATSPRMSDDERFEIFTGFMKQTEIMTTVSDAEITTITSKDVPSAAEEVETTMRSFPAETPRSSAVGASKNRLIEEEGFDGPTGKVRSHDGPPPQWESGRVVTGRPIRPRRPTDTTARPRRPTDPTVTISFDDFEDEDYSDPPAAPSPRPTPATTPRHRPEPRRPSTPSPPPNSAPDYNPCDIRGTCGPNAKCEPVGDEPTCSCPNGFSGIPRNGRPDPQHGCVRTPQSCSATNATTCADDHACIRDVCLQGCHGDTECALGERCIAGQEDGPGRERVCIKICFYDAHCLAGEYCEENVCRPGCRSDSNCPFGQICADGPLGSTRECEEGCNFNNDCPIEQECRGGSCSDPCGGYTECGTNAQCYTVNHLPTCRCPEGYKELNSPYDACVVASADLTLLECLEDSDCGRGSCHHGICRAP